MASVDHGPTSLRYVLEPGMSLATGTLDNQPMSAVRGMGIYGSALRNRSFAAGWNITARDTGNFLAANTNNGGLAHQGMAPAGTASQQPTTYYSVSTDTFTLGSPGGAKGTRAAFITVTTIPAKTSGAGGITITNTTNVTVYYKMRARDVDCGSLTYRVWVVTGAPDYTALLYTGARCGVTPLADIQVDSVWEVAH